MARRALLLVVAACGGAAPPPAPAPANHAPGLVILDRAPPDAATLQVSVVRWSCTFATADGIAYPEGEIQVPLGRPVRLALKDLDTDLDVAITDTPAHVHLTHSATAELAFRIDGSGEYQLQCPVQGSQDPRFPSPNRHTIRAVPATAFAANEASIREAANPTTREGKIALGKKLYEKKGCVGCHTVDGSPRVGPSWARIWGTSVTTADGTTRTVDADYVRESVLHPSAFARPGYPPSMPQFEGYIKPAELDALTTYIESLK